MSTIFIFGIIFRLGNEICGASTVNFVASLTLDSHAREQRVIESTLYSNIRQQRIIHFRQDTWRMGPADDVEGSVEEQVTLSTGQTVTLPLSTDVTMMSVVFSAALDPVRALLPSCLSPVRVGRRSAAVTFLFVRYHSVDEGSLEPYDEFGVLIPATRPSSRATPILSRLPGGVGGYVHSLPVTTEPSRALGDEVWGYPKVVGDIELTESDQRRRIRVAIDGEQFITLEIDQPPKFDLSVSATTESYTVLDGTVIREPLSFDGELGMRLPSKRASYTLGDRGSLKALDIGERALIRCYGRGTFVVHPGKPIQSE